MVKKVWCDRDRNKCYTMLSIDWKVKNVWRCGVKTWDSSGSLKLLVWSLTEQRTQSCSSEWIPIKYHVFFSFDCFNVFPFLHCFLWNKNQKGLIPNRGKHLPFNLLFILHHYNYYIFKSFSLQKKVSDHACILSAHLYSHSQPGIGGKVLCFKVCWWWEVETAEELPP